MASSPIIFRKHLSVGNPAAEEDQEFLRNCFVDSGDVAVLKDLNQPQCIVLGRTGSGKSAILQHITDTEPHVIPLLPQALSLTYVCNSDIISYFERMGVKLDIFYQLLWRHIFAVELIRARYSIDNEHNAQSFFSSLSELFKRDPKKEAAINYLRQWGESFWLETEHRVKEVTNNLETQLNSSVSGRVGAISGQIGGSEKVTTQQKEEVVSRAQKVINSVQMQALGNVIKLLDEDAFNDHYVKYYIVIDCLDEDWVDDPTRYKLIRALIETIKTFRAVRQVKIIVALRSDLLDRVFEHTRDSGFQAEKYESLLVRLAWTRDQLKNLVDQRISYLFKKQYTRESVRFAELFPHKINKIFSFDYMLERTLVRPRDIISFVNECFEKAQGKTEITPRIVIAAEGSYSQKRFDALRDEWSVDHPLLREYCSVRRKKGYSFHMGSLVPSEIDDLALALVTNETAGRDCLAQVAVEYLEGRLERRAFIVEWIRTLYKIGVVGVKPDSFLPVQWSYESSPVISAGSITEGSTFYVHPMVWRALGISESGTEEQSTDRS